LSSLPPDVDVPLPLGPGFIVLPVVGEVPGVAELAAGSPAVDPRPLGAPAWASTHSSAERFLLAAGGPKANDTKPARAATAIIGFIVASSIHGKPIRQMHKRSCHRTPTLVGAGAPAARLCWHIRASRLCLQPLDRRRRVRSIQTLSRYAGGRGRNPPNRVSDIVGNKQIAELVDRQAGGREIF
jgi:hypothetical protein